MSMDAAATFRFVESKTRLVIKLRATIQDNIRNRNIGPYVIAGLKVFSVNLNSVLKLNSVRIRVLNNSNTQIISRALKKRENPAPIDSALCVPISFPGVDSNEVKKAFATIFEIAISIIANTIVYSIHRFGLLSSPPHVSGVRLYFFCTWI